MGWIVVGLALSALRTNRLRTALTMLGIVIGVAAVIAMVSIGSGAQARIDGQIRSMGSNLILVVSGASTSGGIRFGLGTQLTLTEEDARAIAAEVSAVEVVAPAVRGTAQVVSGNANWSTIILGVTPDYVVAREWDLRSGRMFEGADVDGATKVAVLGDTVRKNLFGDADPIGQTIRIRNVPCMVVGVLVPKGQSGLGQDQDDLILLPISTAKRKVLGTAQANPRAVPGILVRILDEPRIAGAQREIRALLRQRHRLQPDQEDDFSASALTDMFAAQEQSARTMTILLAAVASVSLLVGGIGIMNIMLVSVAQRTREIGLRLAVGARDWDILGQFLVEAITLSVVGGLIGVVVGIAASEAIGRLAQWAVEISPGAVALAFGFSAAVGVFFGFYPARKASRLDPMQALRAE